MPALPANDFNLGLANARRNHHRAVSRRSLDEIRCLLASIVPLNQADSLRLHDCRNGAGRARQYTSDGW
jgi:hypothetical protein